MSVILAFDPGYRNLGIALVDTDAGKLLYSTTVNCGGSAAPFAYSKVLLRELPLVLEHGMPKYVATETPPFGFGRGTSAKTAALIWAVMGNVGYWAATLSLPVRTITPISLKKYASSITGIPYRKKMTRTERKAPIHAAVLTLLGGVTGATDHEDDAILAAFALASR